MSAATHADEAEALRAEIEALRATIAGRAVAPTPAELAAHAARGGRWRTVLQVGDPALCGDMLDAAAAERLVSAQRAKRLHVYLWWATEADGELCAWPQTGGSL